MKTIILYRPKSEHSRIVEEYVNDFLRVHGKTIELTDADTVVGVAKSELYDIREYPAILITKDDGELLKHWSGGQLPLMNDIAYYLHV